MRNYRTMEQRHLDAAQNASATLEQLRGCLMIAATYADNHNMVELGWLLTTTQTVAADGRAAIEAAFDI